MIINDEFFVPFCDFAGIASPGALKGLSLKPMLTGEKSPDWRTELVVENNGARMLLFDRHWKYMVDEYTALLDTLKPAEMLFDLDLRPLESKNLAGDKEYGSKRERAVGLMKKWYEDQELSPGGEYPML